MRGAGFSFPSPILPPPHFRSSKPLRLPLNQQRNRAATLQRIASFGHHRVKLGAGYTCSLQAMSCVSRALPDLFRVKRKFKESSATRAAKQSSRSTCRKGGRGSGVTSFMSPRALMRSCFSATSAVNACIDGAKPLAALVTDKGRYGTFSRERKYIPPQQTATKRKDRGPTPSVFARGFPSRSRIQLPRRGSLLVPYSSGNSITYLRSSIGS